MYIIDLRSGTVISLFHLKIKVMERKIVKTEFEVTTTNAGKIFAKVGDTITISNHDAEHYNILKVNDTKIFSRWMRKFWVNSKCE